MIICDYCDKPATRVEALSYDVRNPLCTAHAREHYGADWRTDTWQLTPKKAAEYLATQCP